VKTGRDGFPVSELRYKAYISYSHRDEAWAKWLHRALESYRVPRRLVGKPGSWGDIPARINPVFRDREDLSAARDLGGRITQALAHTESLIIICSPEAAQSRWVNEEIRQYRAVCPAERIYCLIVDGDPGRESSERCCFPPALFEGEGREVFEPLAADVRQWADGKQLAKLKLVAGLLGIRLDELRQRDLQRRRRVRAVSGLGILVALALVVTTLVLQVSRQHEREMAEQLAAFIVDLGEKLKSETDLETLASISAMAMEHFRKLDPRNLTVKTGQKVAVTLRQVGRVSQLQGKPDAALQAFSESRDLLSNLYRKNPASPDLLYELGTAESYIGEYFLSQGDFAHSQSAFEKYHEITGQLREIDPHNADWMMERSYSHNNLAVLRLESGRGVDEASLSHLDRAVALIELVMQQVPDKKLYSSNYANTLAWAATAQYKACNLGNAIALRQKARRLAETLAQSDPGDNDLSRRYAYAISGVAALQTNTGQLALAEQDLELVISMLEQLSAADSSNIVYPQEIAVRQLWLARLMAASGRIGEAQAVMSKLDPIIGMESVAADQNGAKRQDAIDFHIAYARIFYQSGDNTAADLQLETALQLLWNGASHELVGAAREKLQAMRFLWWEINAEQGLENFPTVMEYGPTDPGVLRSCEDALISAKEYVIEGDLEKAAQPVRYLQERGYADPEFVQFCTKYGLCQIKGATS